LQFTADGQDLIFIELELLDGEDRRHPKAAHHVHFDIKGPATLAGVATSHPASNQSYRQPEIITFQGRCVVILRSTRKPGEIRFTAHSEGLPPAQLNLVAR
jgi:beta-galactosidase